MFTGQEHDEKTGLIYFGARYYDPDTARFISQDVYLGEENEPPSLNRYLYAYSNPTVYTDLEGYYSVDDEEFRTGKGIGETVRYEQELAAQNVERATQERIESYKDERKYRYYQVTTEDQTGNKTFKLSELNVSEKGKIFLYHREARKGKSERLHHPTDDSGVTLGPGYDMKGRTEKQIYDDMKAIGLDDDTAQKISKGAGLKGEKADKFIKKNEKVVELTQDQEMALLNKVVPYYVKKVEESFKIDVDLTQSQFDALVSFAYNSGYVYRQIAGPIEINDNNKATEIWLTKNLSGGKPEKGLTIRRQKEVNLFLNAIYEDEIKKKSKPKAPTSRPVSARPKLPAKTPKEVDLWDFCRKFLLGW